MRVAAAVAAHFKARGERNAYLTAYVIVIATQMLTLALGINYSVPVANAILLVWAWEAHRRMRRIDARDDGRYL